MIVAICWRISWYCCRPFIPDLSPPIFSKNENLTSASRAGEKERIEKKVRSAWKFQQSTHNRIKGKVRWKSVRLLNCMHWYHPIEKCVQLLKSRIKSGRLGISESVRRFSSSWMCSTLEINCFLSNATFKIVRVPLLKHCTPKTMSL